MSIWRENPEWFDQWILDRAIEGKFGAEFQKRAEEGDLDPSELWSLDVDGNLGARAYETYIERFME
jgi:hypothetical protein